MNLATILVGAVVLACLLGAAYSVYSNKKKGGCASCSECSGGCAAHENLCACETEK